MTAPTPAPKTVLPERISRFPFPLDRDTYRYSANVETARTTHRTAAGEWGACVIDIDDQYARELALRHEILQADPSRCAILPHMGPACWDAMLTLMRELSDAYPDTMTLCRDGDGWYWSNALLGVEQHFRYGDDTSLSTDPLRFIASQVQEDIVVLEQRDGTLWADAGLVTFASNWSMSFNTGMSFLEIHGPVPRNYADGAIPRAERFLMRLQPGDAYRRVNWTSTVGHRLDTALETYADWGSDRVRILTADIGTELHLRVEVQHLIRLPDTGAILFLIRTYLLPFADIATVPEWRDRLAAVLAELPQDMADYKGFGRIRDKAVLWLTAQAAGTQQGC
ncbi:DUF3445 domain-containing protein [Streptomyces sp. NBC_01537]|uniref:heme-dependent oxidative N-demethylase family protein n=1 Tax=Streptomyces sp. NBC_01537 TaxID=2903896 RepID=UPI00386E344E